MNTWLCTFDKPPNATSRRADLVRWGLYHHTVQCMSTFVQPVNPAASPGAGCRTTTVKAPLPRARAPSARSGAPNSADASGLGGTTPGPGLPCIREVTCGWCGVPATPTAPFLRSSRFSPPAAHSPHAAAARHRALGVRPSSQVGSERRRGAARHAHAVGYWRCPGPSSRCLRRHHGAWGWRAHSSASVRVHRPRASRRLSCPRPPAPADSARTG